MDIVEKYPLMSIASIGSFVGFQDILPLLIPIIALGCDILFRWLHYKKKEK